MIEHYYWNDEIFGENWFSYPNLYKKVVEEFPSGSKFIEVGSWKGRSSAYMAVEIANSKKDIEFYCVDTWEGGPDHQGMDCLETLYETFLENMKPVEEYYFPLKITSEEASKKFKDKSLDFVFIDASHEYEDVKLDIEMWMPKVKPGGILAGHDYYIAPYYDYHPQVKKAVDEKLFGFETSENCWIYRIPNIVDTKVENKLKNFPTINFISIEESQDRRENLYKQFQKYGIKKVVPHIFERYDKTKHTVHSTEWWAKDKEGYLGATTSHLKAIKTWYETTDEPYAFFCEDDISFDSVQYWNFTWEEFFNRLPSDWSCIQLVLFRDDIFKFFKPEVHFRNRCWCDWSATGYLITRDHAKNLLENYYDGETFFLEYKGSDKNIRDEWAIYPTTETLLFTDFNTTIYVFPLFVEDPNFDTTVWDLNQEVPQFHWPCYNAIMEWWRNKGYMMGLDNLFLTEDFKYKLENFPSINFISIQESEDRRNLLYKKFNEYGLTNVTPHIFEKYDDKNHSFLGESHKKLLGIGGRGPVTSHLKAIKNWYFNTDEEYTFFCEDDLSFETLKYWNFTWDEFFSSLPSDWGCVQLSWVREEMFTFSRNRLLKLRPRCWDDWSGCAYLIKRHHAKKLISLYYRDDKFTLDYVGDDSHLRPDWALRPVIETIIFSAVSPIYGIPLFVEDVYNCKSTLLDDNSQMQRPYNFQSYDVVIDWWKTQGKDFTIEKLMN